MKIFVRHLDDIFCMATVGKHEHPNFMVAVNPDTKRVGTCYFKYYNNKDYESSDRVARIDFRSPTLIHHKNRDGKKPWRLNAKDIKNLIDYLPKQSDQYRNIKVNNWQFALYSWNNECGLLGYNFPQIYNSVLEAFLDGFYDTDINLSNPSYVASTLPIPNYKYLR